MITKENTLKEALDIPGAEPVLKKNGVPCMTCPLGAQEINALTIEHVSKLYGLDAENIVKELNELEETNE